MSTPIFKVVKSHTAPTTGSRAADWRDAALCRSAQYDPEMWFPKGTDAVSMANEQEAKATCRRCPVMETCAQWALETGERAGVWGGLNEDERTALRRYGRIPKKRVAIQSFASVQDAYEALAERVGEHVLWVGAREVVIGSVRMTANQVGWRAAREDEPVGRITKRCAHGKCVAHLVDQAMRDARETTTERSAA